jgi:hypothetical protein
VSNLLTHRKPKRGGTSVVRVGAARGDSVSEVSNLPGVAKTNTHASIVVDEVSTGGSATRRWRASKNGGFESFPAKRVPGNGKEEETTSGETTSDDVSSWDWDPRSSPRLRRIFLPAGYPTSVSKDYAPFIRWHLGSLIFRNVLEVLTAQSLLVALGMGNTPGALPLTAATKWVLKDGLGSLSTLAAGSLGGQKYDEDPKRWWAISNALEDVARAIELLTPAAPALFLPLAASATFVRSAALTGRGSLINGTFMQHLGRNENLGDVRAKLEVQGRWLALVALPVGIGIFRAVSGVFDGDAAADAGGTNPYAYLATIGAYGMVIGGHTFCCWKAAVVLRFDTLNRARLVLLATSFVETDGTEVPSVEEAGAAEGVYRARFTQNAPSIGASLPELALDWAGLFMVIELEAGVAVDHGEGNAVRSGTAETPPGVSTGDSAEGVTVAVRREGVTADAATYSGRRYVLGWNCARNVPSVSLAADAEPRHVIAATLAATFAATQINSQVTAPKQTRLDPFLAEMSYRYADQFENEFKRLARRSGWRVDFVQMGTAPKYAFKDFS